MTIISATGEVRTMTLREWLRRPPEPWPEWATALATQRWPADRGLGDTIEHEIGLLGGPAFQKWWATLSDLPAPSCPCHLNQRYPYGQGTSVKQPANRS